MTLNEQWRKEYRENRYMEYVNIEAIEQRVRDIFTNHLILTPEGKLGLPSFEHGGGYWIRLFTHVLEEFQSRGIAFRDGFLKGTPIPKPSWPHVPKAIQALAGREFQPGKHLFKFGKAKHLRDMLLRGKIRVAPASSYSDPSLNHAIRDDELRFTIHFPAKGAFIQKVDEKTLQIVGDKIEVTGGNIELTQEAPTDYLVFCLSFKYEWRAFDDFEADCCLVISDAKQFLDRLLIDVFKQFPDWLARVDAVDYLDPLNTSKDKVRPYFSKHFRYTYQNELRVIWVPPQPRNDLKPVFVELGPLDSIAELIELQPPSAGK